MHHANAIVLQIVITFKLLKFLTEKPQIPFDGSETNVIVVAFISRSLSSLQTGHTGQVWVKLGAFDIVVVDIVVVCVTVVDANRVYIYVVTYFMLAHVFLVDNEVDFTLWPKLGSGNT